MRRPGQPAFTDAGTGRVSMPFLPTLGVVALLGVASLYCPSSSPPKSRPPLAQLDPLTTASLAAAPVTAPSLAASPTASPTAFARAATGPAVPGRMPASLAFAEAYPLDGSAPKAPAIHAGGPVRAAPRLAVASRRPCPGRRCPEAPQRAADPFAAAHADTAEPVEDGAVPQPALPFADTVAQTLAPAARVVGDAADLVRTGAAAVRGTVSLAVADCLR
ncbi:MULTISPECIES: hypothetical protein [Methylobacterium]|uniref:Uncharacterized protein n=1 Tax=Methylobacterium longum TaxID=767694 RepID=A0ABT8AKU2_9HYPH|nr:MULTISPECIES: hypothetical protein [Methylobacterium]MCJ2099920.1 hypothetical protein [Methylobacterium sp. E-046]MDN3570357.1 hypothetical protein [Methylobacterium longum]GJE11354.1 hypothetical protein FOHLNKBM_2397 [Methylobacterium longum]